MRDKPYCNAPWLGLYYEGTVGIRPCCEWKPDSFPGNYKQYTESEYLKDFKRNMYNDEPVPGCIECTHNEKIGGHSRRKYYEKFTDVDYEASGIQYIARMDFRAGNKCNMMCRMCGPSSSSLLEEEAIESGAQEIGFIKHLDTSDIYDLDLSNCEEVSILGGEPSIDLKVRKFMDYIADNYPTIKVQVTTNATNGSDKWFKTLMKFCVGAGLNIILSVDAAGPTQEFQRKSKISWETIKKNLEKYREVFEGHPNCQISIQLTCTAINLVTIDKWWDEVVDLDISLMPNQVWYPEGMAVSCIPISLKHKSVEFLNNWRKKYKPKSTLTGARVDDVYRAVDTIINILETTKYTGTKNFIEIQNRYDGDRNENVIDLDKRFELMMYGFPLFTNLTDSR
jgi:hypothetical protein